MTTDEGSPAYRGHLTENTVTIAEVLRAAGYRTAMFGKWHLSITTEPTNHLQNLNNQVIRQQFADLKSYPVNRGFDEYYGVIWGVVNFFDPFSLVHNTEAIRAVPRDFYLTDALTDRALEYIEARGRDHSPFFLYAAYTAPHWPLHARPADIAKYKDTYKAGWDVIRNQRYQRQLKLGLFDAGQAALSERIRPELSWENNPDQEFDAACMAVHAAMIDRLDQNIGRILDRLTKMKLLENTLIVFLSDNGASPEVPAAGGFDRPTQTRDGRAILYTKQLKAAHTMPGPETTFAAIGPMWANVANTPFRFWKKEIFEGGICTPCIVHWPKGLKTRPGSFTSAPAHVIDLLPTFAALAGARYPTEFGGHSITPLEGRSLAPLLEGQPLPQGPIFWEHYGARGVREGNWKLVALGKSSWELYDLNTDRTETTNVAREQSAIVTRLSQAWDQWARRCNVVLPPP
jgi:arylsulfatase